MEKAVSMKIQPSKARSTMIQPPKSKKLNTFLSIDRGGTSDDIASTNSGFLEFHFQGLVMKSGRERSLERVKRVVVVAIKASREISKTALEWALTHVVQPGDLVKLLVVIPVHSSSPNRWSLRRLNSDCTASKWRSLAGTFFDQKDMITDSCTEILIQLQGIYDSKKIRVKIDVVSESHCGAVAAEADTSQARWVVLDRRMKKEAKLCMEKLECNLVVMKKSGPKVLRLNLTGPSEPQTEVFSRTEVSANRDLMRVPNVTPASSPEHTTFTTTDVGTSSLSSLDLAMSPFSIPGINWDRKKDRFLQNERYHNHGESDSDTDSEKLSSSQRFNSFKYKSFVEKLSEPEGRDSSKNMREIISLTTNTPLDPPPLCSICRHKAPVFGKPPKWFTYAELERATDGFSKANFLAEGGYGSVHRGVLADGRVIAVKQHKLASSQGDNEFCSEVEVLSCAQHRNVVMLNGFCVEDKKRLLVYEYICNGSLDVHLYGRGKDPLDWSARQKIAIGAARGLRYLHEECRVGCIVHRDMRPNNILLTHDFEPLVGDFGLARWQPNGDLGVETRIIGTFGYMAPEYAQSGQVTEKADVYAFGVVLVELVTGRKAVDMNRPKGQQCLTEWARPLLEKNVVLKLVDPQLRDSYSEQEISTMIHCASLCLRRDPHSRPRMSQVLRTLEGDKFM